MSYQTITSLFPEWKADLFSGNPPTRYQVGSGFDTVWLAPKRVLLIGGPPGSGKTALVMQWMFDALRFHPTLRAVVCNVEMDARDLLERELARVSGVPLSHLQTREFKTHPEAARKAESGMTAICALAERVSFVNPPFALENVAEAVDATEADIIILDYIQRIPPYAKQQIHDTRQQNTEAMSLIRLMANNGGKAVVVVSAVARDKTHGGKAYANMTLGSFRDTSELEFGADQCYLVERDITSIDNAVRLRNPKSKYTALADITCRFVGQFSKFVVGGENG